MGIRVWAPPTHLPPPPLLSRPANRSVRDPPPPFTVGETEARGSRRCLRPCPCLLPSPGHWDQCLRKGLRSLICGCGLSINKGGQSPAVAVLGLWGSWGVCVTHGAFQRPPPSPIRFLQTPAAASPCGTQTGGVSGEKRQSGRIWEDVEFGSHSPALLGGCGVWRKWGGAEGHPGRQRCPHWCPWGLGLGIWHRAGGRGAENGLNSAHR